MKYIVYSIIIFVVILSASSCQTVQYKEFYPNKNLNKDYKKSGIPDWSNNKSGTISISGIGI